MVNENNQNKYLKRWTLKGGVYSGRYEIRERKNLHLSFCLYQTMESSNKDWEKKHNLTKPANKDDINNVNQSS